MCNPRMEVGLQLKLRRVLSIKNVTYGKTYSGEGHCGDTNTWPISPQQKVIGLRIKPFENTYSVFSLSVFLINIYFEAERPKAQEYLYTRLNNKL